MTSSLTSLTVISAMFLILKSLPTLQSTQLANELIATV